MSCYKGISLARRISNLTYQPTNLARARSERVEATWRLCVPLGRELIERESPKESLHRDPVSQSRSRPYRVGEKERNCKTMEEK